MKKVVLTITVFSFLISMLQVGCGKKLSEQEYYDLAVEYEQNEDFEKAAETFMSLFKRYPTGMYGGESLFKAALIQENQLKQYNRAIDTHRRLMRAFPESKYSSQSMFLIGFIYANDIKDYEKAEEIYKDFLNQFPDDELVSSVQWELDNLGKDINDMNFIDKPDTSKSY